MELCGCIFHGFFCTAVWGLFELSYTPPKSNIDTKHDGFLYVPPASWRHFLENQP